MRSDLHLDPSALARAGRLFRLGLALWLGATAVVAPAFPQDRLLVKGLVDAEIWKTDDGSRLLSRNGGDRGTVGRLRLWAAEEFHPKLLGFVLGEIEGGEASPEGTTETELEQVFLRYSILPRERLVLQAGKMTTPIGNFAKRYFSSVNPLIGAPDTYDVSYPRGVQLTGWASRFDYRVAVIDLPLINEKYLPEPEPAPRPALSAGVSPVTGLRVGGYLTRGPYLNSDLDPLLPPGADWKDYKQRLVGLDVRFSRGHFEFNGDGALSGYDVPTQSAAVRGRAFYLEPKYTWTPRLFTALRFERNDYAFIRPISSTSWLARSVNLYDLEVGVGYRIRPDMLVKVAYRRDRWDVEEGLKPLLPNGYSFSAQLSYSFDVRSWFDRPLQTAGLRQPSSDSDAPCRAP